MSLVGQAVPPGCKSTGIGDRLTLHVADASRLLNATSCRARASAWRLRVSAFSPPSSSPKCSFFESAAPPFDERPVTLVGFPEHIFSQSAGFATSIYAAQQERYFGTFFQRVLVSPLDVRMHYGHPDLADKLHFLR